MNYDKLCNDVLELDPLIRFAAVINPEGARVAGGYRNNISSMLSPDEVNNSLHYAAKRWEARGTLAHRIGEAKYSITEYEKVKQLTIPVNKKDLLLISTETNSDHVKIVNSILELLEKLSTI